MTKAAENQSSSSSFMSDPSAVLHLPQELIFPCEGRRRSLPEVVSWCEIFPPSFWCGSQPCSVVAAGEADATIHDQEQASPTHPHQQLHHPILPSPPPETDHAPLDTP